MKEKTFEEQFPGLKGKIIPWWKNSNDSVDYPAIPYPFVEEFCLDKQRVKYAISKKEETAKKLGCYYETEWIFTEFKKELGL